MQLDDVDELLYGGAVYGGKSDFLLGDFAQDVPGPYGKYWHGILFRKTYKQLEELISRSKEIYPQWFPGCRWYPSSSDYEKCWVWPNGATLKMRHMDSDDDWVEYWGHSYTWIGWDELALWASDVPYNRMKARLRCAQYPIPNMRIRSSANPGGAGHQWVKSYFGIDRWPLGGRTFEADDDSGMRRIYIKSRLSDNKIGTQNDPNYARRLNGLGSKEYVRALKDGDWDVVAGAFFSEWRADAHVIKPMSLPRHWTRMCSMDWGSAKPFAIYWFAVSDGELAQFPRGALVFYREWYGVKLKDNGAFEPNVGLKMKNEDIGAGIVERETYFFEGKLQREEVQYAALDPSCFKEDGGPSISEQIGSAGVWFAPADNSRVAGWGQVRSRLEGEDGRPMIYFFETCEHAIRTLPALQHDRNKPEDVDTDSEDHAGDAIRYGCMARPWIRTVEKPKETRFAVSAEGATVSVRELLDKKRKARERQ